MKYFGDPVTHAQFYGPDEWYILSMHTGFAAKAGLNSLTLNVTGKKNIVYKDGSKIYCNTAPGDIFNNAFFGSLNHQFTGKLEYFDDENKIYATYSIGTQKVQDYLEGFIQKDGKKISEIYGTYCGYLEFDGERYWDARDTIKFEVKPSDRLRLPSDSRNRIDLVSLISGDVEEAQENKEKLEIDQRNDAKLRGHH